MTQIFPCQTKGCVRPAIRLGKTLCYACYMRQYRKGTTDYRVPKEVLDHSAGYVIVRAKDHPLAVRRDSTYEYEHRVVFYDNHGEGPFACHWCGIKVTWDDMHVDHVNEIKSDNSPLNLVASCCACNQGRCREKTNAAIRAATGKYFTAFGRTLCIGEWARELGISNSALMYRIKNGWAIERALSERRGKTGPKSTRR